MPIVGKLDKRCVKKKIRDKKNPMTTDYDYDCGFDLFGLDEMYRKLSLFKHLQVVLNGPYNTQITMDKSGMKYIEANEKIANDKYAHKTYPRAFDKLD